MPSLPGPLEVALRCVAWLGALGGAVALFLASQAPLVLILGGVLFAVGVVGLAFEASIGISALIRRPRPGRSILTPQQADRHLDEIHGAALTLYTGGLSQTLALGADQDRNRRLLMGHCSRIRKPLASWESLHRDWTQADARARARAKAEESRLGLRTSGFWDILHRVAIKHAVLTGAGVAFGETIHPKDGAIWVVLSDGDHAIAHYQTDAERDRVLQRLQEAIWNVRDWRETKRLRKAQVRILRAKGEMAASLEELQNRVVLRGTCEYCRP